MLGKKGNGGALARANCGRLPSQGRGKRRTGRERSGLGVFCGGCWNVGWDQEVEIWGCLMSFGLWKSNKRLNWK